jgi:transposase InsO family protein
MRTETARHDKPLKAIVEPGLSIEQKVRARVARELDRLLAARAKPTTTVSDNGTELTSNAILRWADDTRSLGTTSRRASRGS